MTQKQLREISAYWGAECSNSTGTMSEVNAYTMGILETTYVPEFKVHLRPLMSLTDSEIICLANIFSFGSPEVLANKSENDPLLKINHEIVRKDALIVVFEYLTWRIQIDKNFKRINKINSKRNHYMIDTSMEFCQFFWKGNFKNNRPVAFPLIAVAYLHSLFVYMPDAIDEKFVELI